MIPLQKHFFGTLYILTKYALLKRLKKKINFLLLRKYTRELIFIFFQEYFSQEFYRK